ncbi:LUD domain-containing protein [Sediminicola luteus]|uniref:Lactate utilization protein B/C n=1 Tax=Sediminicola luteus TaxID=319238 RepID=A0A2A4G6U4_9FLAO|nr:LUD domain-containing protein [Sediminicola luteus]PCE63475.1 lactate utilization protein B/C [Sediminicola luteus]
MGLFGKLFGGGKKTDSDTVETRGAHMPDLDIPVDEKFTINFKRNGGKFLYCDSFSEITDVLDRIIIENQWQDQPFFSLDTELAKRFISENFMFTNRMEGTSVFFTTCEHLIAHNGSILVSSNQLHGKKLQELPDNFIVFATTSQLVESIGDGLKSIKKNSGNGIPANITTIKHFKEKSAKEEDFLSYGSTSKNLYLLLLEDF